MLIIFVRHSDFFYYRKFTVFSFYRKSFSAGCCSTLLFYARNSREECYYGGKCLRLKANTVAYSPNRGIPFGALCFTVFFAPNVTRM